VLMPVSLAADAEQYHYIAGGGTPSVDALGAHVGSGGVCATRVDDTGIGGICGLPVDEGETIRITVVDDVKGDVPFFVSFGGATDDLVADFCADGIEGSGSVTFVAPAGCDRLDIQVGVTAAMGTILIERL
ncbi:MAG TPA: hypothetical protein VM370_07895, partial [Candidatus Thermoplasmatota archaeon]|nr:hypothetical protein [Candidatus Thermoplasmatota archaeon]